MKIGRFWKEQRTQYFVEVDGARIVLGPGSPMANFNNPFDESQMGGLRDFIAAGVQGLGKVPGDAPLAPPIAVTGIDCIGLNYKAHAEECGAEWQKFQCPTLFGRSANSVNSPNGHVVIPEPSRFRNQVLYADSEKAKKDQLAVAFDYEVELAAVIGRPCYRVSPEEALDYVLGYCVANDLSERVAQLWLTTSGQWEAGKSKPTSFPLGPVLVTADEIGDPQTLRMSLHRNGAEMQQSSTSDMIFSVAECISFCSHVHPLPPGYVISTGTPGGVVVKMPADKIDHSKWLKAGDTMNLRIWRDGDQAVDLGTQTQTCVAEDDSWLEFFRSDSAQRGAEFHSAAK